jgi:hypothetical protein
MSELEYYDRLLSAGAALSVELHNSPAGLPPGAAASIERCRQMVIEILGEAQALYDEALGDEQ